MYKFMRKYNRKLLSLATVFLVIAFFMPQFKGGGRTPGEATIGRVGSEKIVADQVNNARAEWNMLKSMIVYPNGRNQRGEPSEVPLASTLGESAIRQMEEHPPMFLLLLKEARDSGVSVSQRDLSTELGQINIHLPDGRTVLYENLGDSELADQVRLAVRDYMLIRATYERAASVVKVSRPLLSNRLAKEQQEIKLNLIEFDAKPFMDKVSPPSAEALQKQFDRYADTLSAQYDPADSDPSGFGYKFPDRVKLQYVGIARDQVKAAVKASKSDYEWEVEAQRYYRKNAKQFPVTQPTSAPTDSFSLDSTTRPSKPTTGPATRPFAEVRAQVLDAIIDPQVDKLAQAVATKITVTMANDYGLYRAAMRTAGTTAPATMPLTSFGVPYDSFDYLQKLSAEVQKEFKVLPTVVSLGEAFLTEKQLEKLPGIGESFTTMRQMLLTFPQYAFDLGAPFHENREEALHLFEISRPLLGREMTFFFRLTAADPAHKPASLSEVIEAVTHDVTLTDAMKLARASADATMQAAKSVGFRQAAIAANKAALTTGFFSSDPRRPIPSYSVEPDSQRAFIDGAFALLHDAAKDPNSAPIGLIDLPREGKVLVAQLADIRAPTDTVRLALAQAQVSNELSMQLRQNLYDHWFTWDDLTRRLKYEDETHGSKKNTPEI